MLISNMVFKFKTFNPGSINICVSQMSQIRKKDVPVLGKFKITFQKRYTSSKDRSSIIKSQKSYDTKAIKIKIYKYLILLNKKDLRTTYYILRGTIAVGRNPQMSKT